MTVDQAYDARGLLCPLPVLRARKLLAGMATGEVLAITADDALAQVDIPHFCAEAGHVLIDVTEAGSAQQRFALEPVGMSGLIGQVLDEVAARLVEGDLARDMKIDPSCPNLVTDPNLLSKVIAHMAKSALEFSGGAGLKIEAGCIGGAENRWDGSQYHRAFNLF